MAGPSVKVHPGKRKGNPMLTRNGSVYPLDQFVDLVNEVKTTFPRNTQTHGELMVKKDGDIMPRQVSNGILNSLQKNGTFGEKETPFFESSKSLEMD